MAERSVSQRRTAQAVAMCHLFAACGSAERERIAQIAQPRQWQRGDVVFAQGEPGDAFHIVLAGVFRILRTTAEGQEVHLHVVRPGEIFGLAPFFLDRPYPAMAVCSTTRGETLRFPRVPFLRLMDNSQELSRHLCAGLALKLHEFTHRFESLTAQTIHARLARYLILDLAGEAKSGLTCELPMSKRNLAAHLGATPESLSRALRKLADDGLIRIEGKRVTLLGADALTELANLD